MSTDLVRVAVLADTHLRAGADGLPPPVLEILDAVDVILHAGDVVSPQLLEELAAIAPTHAVLGNNDHDLVGALPDRLELDLGGVRTAMVHDSGSRTGRANRLKRWFPDAQLVVFGHSHDPQCDDDGDLLLFNPGSPTQRRRQPVHTVGWLELDAGRILTAEVIPVGPLV